MACWQNEEAQDRKTAITRIFSGGRTERYWGDPEEDESFWIKLDPVEREEPEDREEMSGPPAVTAKAPAPVSEVVPFATMFRVQSRAEFEEAFCAGVRRPAKPAA
jgi:hypothetical protein